MSFSNLPNWQKRDCFRTSPHQALVDAINQNGSLIPQEGLESWGAPNSRTLVPEKIRILWEDYGVVLHQPPAGLAPLGREQYWVALGGFSPRNSFATPSVANRIRLIPDQLDVDADVVIATNTAEMARFDAAGSEAGSGSGSGSGAGNNIAGLHTVMPGRQVLIRATSLSTVSGSIVVYTFHSPPTVLYAKITGVSAVPTDANRSRYTWVEQRLTSQGAWEDQPNGLDSSSFSPVAYAYSLAEYPNGGAGFAIDDMVTLKGWTNADNEQEFIIESAAAKLPIFQYPGMGWFTVTNNQNAGAFPFAVQSPT